MRVVFGIQLLIVDPNLIFNLIVQELWRRKLSLASFLYLVALDWLP